MITKHLSNKLSCNDDPETMDADREKEKETDLSPFKTTPNIDYQSLLNSPLLCNGIKPQESLFGVSENGRKERLKRMI